MILNVVKNSVGNFIAVVLDVALFFRELILLRVVDVDNSKEVISQDFLNWKSTFSLFSESNLPSESCISISNRRAVVDPYNGILHFYLSLAALFSLGGKNVKIYTLSQIPFEYALDENVSLIGLPPKIKLAFRWPGSIVSSWSRTIREKSIVTSRQVFIAPNAGMEFLSFSYLSNSILTLHTDWLTEYNEVSILRAARQNWMKRFYRCQNSNLVISNSRALLEDLRQLGAVFDRNTPIETISHISQFSSQNKQKGKIILVLGKMSNRKNPIEMIKAWESACSELVDWKLVFAGPFGRQTKSVLRRSRRLPRVEVLGPVSPNTKIELLSSASIVVVPSKYESFGYLGSEGISVGAKVILRDLPTLRESTPDGNFFSSTKELEEKLVVIAKSQDMVPQKPISENSVLRYIQNWVQVINRLG